MISHVCLMVEHQCKALIMKIIRTMKTIQIASILYEQCGGLYLALHVLLLSPHMSGPVVNVKKHGVPEIPVRFSQ